MERKDRTHRLLVCRNGLRWLWLAGMLSLALPVAARGAASPFTEYPVPSAGSQPTGIIAGPDGNLWFTEFQANKIGRITPAGVITESPLASRPDRTAISGSPRRPPTGSGGWT